MRDQNQTAVESDDSTPLRLDRGLLAAAIAGMCGAGLVILMSGLSWLMRGLASGSLSLNFLRFVDHTAVAFCVMTSACGSAAFATWGPRGRHRFLGSLAIVLFGGLFLTVFVAPMQWSPKRVKGVAHPPLYLSEVMMFVVPQATVGCWLTLVRSLSVARKEPLE